MENPPETPGTGDVHKTEDVQRETAVVEEHAQAVRGEHPGAAMETSSGSQMPPPSMPGGQGEGAI